jgi:hypothetical protein
MHFFETADPEVPKTQNHRSFLKEHVVFKEVLYSYFFFCLFVKRSILV